jgi:Helicase subunit of the DNA excision repair complex
METRRDGRPVLAQRVKGATTHAMLMLKEMAVGKLTLLGKCSGVVSAVKVAMGLGGLLRDHVVRIQILQCRAATKLEAKNS